MRLPFGSLVLFAMIGCGSTTTEPEDDGGTDVSEGGDSADVGPDDVVPDDGGAETDVPGDVDPEVPADADGGAETDVPTCPTWWLADVTPDEVTLGDPIAVTVGRTTRLLVSHYLDCQQRRAMPEVEVLADARRAVIQPRIWDTVRECMGPAVQITRWIPIFFPVAGTWTVESPPGTAALTVEVGAEPPTPCGLLGGGCDEDCDCPTGEACLGSWGIAGTPFTACAIPCEEDLDCSNGKACVDMDDGFDRTCSDSTPQCGGGSLRECPFGYACDGGACRPDFTLGMAARAPCSCADDCTPPLRCVDPSEPGGTRRCELACPTGGAWCPGAHACGPAADDLSGMAATDSVCGWLGD